MTTGGPIGNGAVNDTPLTGDIPEAAYINTLRAIDAFDGTTSEYEILLTSQRTSLEERNFAAVEMMILRGDRLARDARAYGQQLSSFRQALIAHAYAGPRATELSTRITAAERRAHDVGRQAAELMAMCGEAQRAASIQLEEPSHTLRNARNRYNTGQHRAIMFDTVR